MRYFQPKEYQYVSQYTPDMAAMDYQKGQDLLKQEDAFNTNLNDVKKKFTLSKGQYTSQRLVDEANNAINTNLNKITQDLYSNKISAREANNQINNVATYFNSDPGIQAIIADKALTEKEKADVASGKLNPKNSLNTYGAPTWSMNEGKRVKEIDDINELTGKLSKLYNTIDPGDPIKVAQGALKGILEKSGSSTFIPGKDYRFEYRDVTGKPGEKLLVAIDEGGHETSSVGISPTQIKTAITDLVKANRNTNPDQFWEWHNRNQSTDDEIINQLMGSYPGSFNITTDKKEENKYQVISDGSTKKGKGSSEDNPNNLPQETVTVMNNGRNIIIGGKTLNSNNAASTTKAILDNRETISANVSKKAQEFKDSLKEKDGSIPDVKIDTNNDNKLIYEGKDPLIYAQVQEFNANTAQSLIKQNQAELIAQSALDVVHDVYPNFNPLDIEGEDSVNKLVEKSALPYLNSLSNETWITVPKIDKSKVYKTIDDLDVAKEDVLKRLETVNYLIENNLENAGAGGFNIVSLYKDKLSLNNILDNINNSFKAKNILLEKLNPGYKLYSETLKKQLEGNQYRGERTMIITDESAEGEGKYLKSIITNAFSDVAKRSKDIVSSNTNDDLKEFWEKYDDDEKVKEAVQKAIQNKSRVRGDIADNEWVMHIDLGKEEGFDKPYSLEIKSPENQLQLMDYAESHGYDADYFKVMAQNNYGQTLKASDGVYGIINSYAPNQNGFDLYTRTVTVPRTVDGVKLEEGETVFTLPSQPGYLFRVNSDRNKMFLFHNDMDEAVVKGDVQRQNQILQNISAYGIEPIYNKKLADQYSRDVKLNIPAVRNKVNSPKVEVAQEEVNKYETIIKRKQETGRSGSVLTDKELQEKLAEAKQNLENAKLGK